MCPSCAADLVQTLLTTHHQCTINAQQSQDFAEGVTKLFPGNTEQHALWSDRIEHGSQDIVDSPEVELSPYRRNVGERRVVVRPKEEEEGRVRQECRELVYREGQAAAKREQQVG